MVLGPVDGAVTVSLALVLADAPPSLRRMDSDCANIVSAVHIHYKIPKLPHQRDDNTSVKCTSAMTALKAQKYELEN